MKQDEIKDFVSGVDSIVLPISSALQSYAVSEPEKTAFIYLDSRGREQGSLTNSELYLKAKHVADGLRARMKPGDRALLAFPAGLDFVVAFLGCLLAGVVAVPIAMPKQRRLNDATLGICKDCAPSIGLTQSESVQDLNALFAGHGVPEFPWIDVEIEPSSTESYAIELPDAKQVAFLQYTSGSTSAPKGVMVTHANLSANLAMMTQAYTLDSASTRVSWLPHYHDMGLIFGILQACATGALCVLLSPISFIKNPMLWLASISKYQAELAIGTNFSFDLCVNSFRNDRLSDVDLSCWKLAINGAEPVKAETLKQFSATFEPYGFDMSAFHPGYGMAEATLVVSGGRFASPPLILPASRSALQANRVREPDNGKDQISLVGCGRALPMEDIAIVDPDTLQRCDDTVVGEIWVRGPHVAAGYWRNDEKNQETFYAQLRNEPGFSWLRTGDLGYLDHREEVFVTGRLKDLIIVKGKNFYPQDIEGLAEQHPMIRPGYVAAFGVVAEGREQVVLVCELNRQGQRLEDTTEIERDIRGKLIDEHELGLMDLILARTGAVPRTTSGKVRRGRAKAMWQAGELTALRWSPALNTARQTTDGLSVNA